MLYCVSNGLENLQFVNSSSSKTKKEKKYKRNKTQDTPKAWFWKEPRGEGEGVSEVGERMEREGRKILEFLKMKKRG